jgi:TalC/MipB family fructose-6-phosphate aldolase
MHMALYVDSAFVEDVARLAAAYPIAGVTTNPTILLTAFERGQRLRDVEVLRELLQVCAGPVFMQPTAGSRDELRKAALTYVDVNPQRVVLKLPATPLGLQAAHDLAGDGALVAFTAVASVPQVYLGTMMGAQWVIPYFCRLRRAGVDVNQEITDMARLLDGQQSSTRILAASLKTPRDIIEATLAGAHDVTAPPDVIAAMATSAMTEAAVTQFASDWERLRQL